MKKTAHFLVLLLILSVVVTAHGQDRKRVRKISHRYSVFEAGVVAGRSFSQLDGDYFTGFDKGGWYGGLRGVANLSARTGLHVEMLYSQKGSRIPHGTTIGANSVNDRLVSMDFAEVPLILRYLLTEARNPGFIEFGGYYGRLIQTSIEERPATSTRGGTQYEDIATDFKSSEMGLLAGLGISFGRHLELSFRYSYALTKIYNDQDFQLPPVGSLTRKEVQFLRNYHLSILIAYRLL